MKETIKYKVKPGCGDFNEGDSERYEGRIGVLKRRIESGWMEGCFILEFPDDGDEEAFFKGDLELVKE